MSAPEADETALEPYIQMPRGGVAARCQRVKKDGSQCAKPARREFSICSSHGAGYRSREVSGERKTPGRPVTHGVYSVTPTSSYAEVMSEVAQLEDVLTNSDADLLALKATLLIRLGQLGGLTPEVERFEADLEGYVTEAADMSDDPLTPADAMALARRFAGWLRPLTKIDGAVGRVADGATKSIVAHKTRAETSAKLAEVEGLGAFLTLNRVHRAVFHSLTSDMELIGAYESALQREVYGPQRLEVPPLDMNVLTYPVEYPLEASE